MSISTTTKLVISTGTIATGALLGAASWYTKGVAVAKPHASLQKVTEKGAYVDTFYYKLPLERTPKLSASKLAKSLFCSPSFLPEKMVLSLMAGQTFPRESEYDSLPMQPGTKIAYWTVETAKNTELLMNFPGGYTFLKTNYQAD